MLESSSQQTEPRQPDPGEAETRPTAWWRNQRRWFYLIVTLLPLALLWGGWSWWYRSNFPMTSIEWLDQMGIGYELANWKIARETRIPRLEGTSWNSPSDPNLRLTFELNGTVGFRPPGDWNQIAVGLDGGDAVLDAREQAVLTRWDGANYRKKDPSACLWKWELSCRPPRT